MSRSCSALLCSQRLWVWSPVAERRGWQLRGRRLGLLGAEDGRPVEGVVDL